MPVKNIVLNNPSKDPTGDTSIADPEIWAIPQVLTLISNYGNNDVPNQQVIAHHNGGYIPGYENINVVAVINFTGASGWMEKISEVVSDNDTLFNFHFEPTILAPGLYHAIIEFRLMGIKPGGYVESVLAVASTAIHLQINSVDHITPQPNQVNFSHQLGEALPPAKPILINSNVDWNIVNNNTEISVSQSNGSGNANIQIGLTSDVNNLASGTHNFTITVSDGTITSEISIVVVVVNSSDFNVSPDELNFNHTKGDTSIEKQLLNIFSIDPWNVLEKPNWIILSANAGNNSQSIEVEISNIASFDVGTYNGNIKISDGTSIIDAPVVLKVFEFLDSVFQTGKTYFTKDLHYLEFATENDNSFIDITMNVSINNWDTSIAEYSKKFKVPLYKKQGSFHPGTIVQHLLDELQTVSQSLLNLQNGVVPQYKSAQVDILIKEIDFDTKEVYTQTNIDGIRFFKGKKPPNSLLTASKGMSRLSKNDKIILPFIFNTVGVYGKGILPPDQIVNQLFYKLNDNEAEEINFFGTGNDAIYTLVKSVSANVGDVIRIYNQDTTINKYFTVLPDGEEKVQLFFENINGVIESIQLTGELYIGSKYVRKTSKQLLDLYEKETTIYSQRNQNIKINTGWMLADDIVTLHTLINSKKIWICLNMYGDKTAKGYTFIELRATTKNLSNYKTNDNLKSFELDFKIIENTDDTIYP